ncbi:MAG: ParB/RepB/Spo0J family partition protein [Aquamicrobium sp.]|uniref:ParB/RepB/Spo0J family partition protein n=1 Tax=Aquamicrobium sp. TaxID=1872579 RepID=UPI00349EAFB6|nr:ParB/RepB/Spo0J family partition protein [Aquamicrobium sp.]
MSALQKTKKLLRLDIPLGLLEKNEDNPNKMSAREFDLLIDNMEKTGITDAILVRPLDFKLAVDLAAKDFDESVLVAAFVENKLRFRIVGGHHRFDGAAYLGFETVPCTVIMDPKFDEEAEKFQLVRMNMIRGRMDPQAFFDLYNKLASSYTDEVLQDAFGFAEAAEFRKLIEQTAKALPDKHLQKKFKEAAEEIKTVDGLSKLLNEMFTKYGDTLPFGFMVFDHGGQRSMWLRIEGKTMNALDVIGDICIENERTVDDVVGQVLQLIAKGEMADALAKILKKVPKHSIPEGLAVAPTKEHLAKIAAV